MKLNRILWIVWSLTGSLASATTTMTSPEFSFSTRCEAQGPSAILSFTGDILVHDGLYRQALKQPQNFAKLWDKTNGLISKADFSVGNLEGPAALGIDAQARDLGDVGFIYDKVVYSGTDFVFNYHPQILTDLKDTGYDLLSMANNHSLDRRGKGIDRTLEAAQRVGIATVGTRHSQDRNAEFYTVAQIKDLRVAFISCTEMSNGIPDRNDQVLFCYKHKDKIVSMIQQLSRQSNVDAVIVLPHWGQEYQPLPEANQKRYGRLFLEAGATAVIGAHPHVLQPWEKYTTRDGRETVLIYSLGNFLAYQAGLERKTGAIAYLGLTKSNGKTALSGVAYTPTYREGTWVSPVSNMSGDIGRLVISKFGASRFVSPQGDVRPALCR